MKETLLKIKNFFQSVHFKKYAKRFGIFICHFELIKFTTYNEEVSASSLLGCLESNVRRWRNDLAINSLLECKRWVESLLFVFIWLCALFRHIVRTSIHSFRWSWWLKAQNPFTGNSDLFVLFVVWFFCSIKWLPGTPPRVPGSLPGTWYSKYRGAIGV